MNHLENMKPISGTFEATGDFTDWLNELKKSSIVEIDIIGLHDKTTGEKREFVAFDKVFEIIDAEVGRLFQFPEGVYIQAEKAMANSIRRAIIKLKEGEQE